MGYTGLFGRGFRLGGGVVKPMEAPPAKDGAGTEQVRSGSGYRGAFMRKSLPRTLQVLGATLQQIENPQGQLNAFAANEADQQRQAAEEMAQARQGKVEDQRYTAEQDWRAGAQQRERDQYAWQRQYDTENPEPMTPYQQAQIGLTRRGQDMDFVQSQITQQSQPWEPNTTDRSMLQGVMTNGQQATEGLQALDRFQEANNHIGTGPAGQYTNYFDPRMATIRQQSSLLQTMMAPQGQGQVSNYERALFAQSAPEAGLTGPQNQERINNLRTLFRIRQARADFYDSYGSQYRTLRGAEQAFQQSEQFRSLAGNGRNSPPPPPPAADIRIDSNGNRIVR